MSASVLVTGASGFVGTHLMMVLGDRAISSRADVTKREAVAAEVTDVAPGAVIHLAAASSVADSWAAQDAVWQVNVLGTVNVLETVARAAPAARVLVASSGEVYGDTGPRPADEARPLAPVSPYAASKAAAEVACERARRVDELDVVVARPFSHLGPGQDDRFAVGSWARQLARLERAGGGVVRVGALDARRDVLDVRDVCRAYELLLDPAVPAGVYNVASGKAVAMSAILEELVRQTRCRVILEPDPSRMRPADVRVLCGDASKLRQVTGWAPEIPLEQTLADALNHARAESTAEVPG